MNETIQKVKKIRKHQSVNMSGPKVLIMDIITMFFSLSPGLLSWFSVIFYIKYFWNHPYFLLLTLAVPFLGILTFLAAVSLLRIIIPKVKPGVYKLGLNKGFLSWYIHLCIGGSPMYFGLHPFFNGFYTTKYLFWRIMGAKVAYGINSSVFANFRDYPLLTIKKGCTIGADCFVSAHTFVGNKLLLKPVEINENVFIGGFCKVGPGTKIGKNSWIGMSNVFIQDEVPENTKIDHFEWEHFKPGKYDSNTKTIDKETHIKETTV